MAGYKSKYTGAEIDERLTLAEENAASIESLKRKNKRVQFVVHRAVPEHPMPHHVYVFQHGQVALRYKTPQTEEQIRERFGRDDVFIMTCINNQQQIELERPEKYTYIISFGEKYIYNGGRLGYTLFVHLSDNSKLDLIPWSEGMVKDVYGPTTSKDFIIERGKVRCIAHIDPKKRLRNSNVGRFARIFYKKRRITFSPENPKGRKTIFDTKISRSTFTVKHKGLLGYSKKGRYKKQSRDRTRVFVNKGEYLPI